MPKPPVRKPSRRDLLRAVGGAGVLLWPIILARRARAGADARLVVLYFPNGAPGAPGDVSLPAVAGDRWDWTGRVTEPLRPFEDRIAFCDGLRLQLGQGGAHNPAACGFLTGASIVEGERRGRHNGDTPRTRSLDDHVARATGTPLLYLAVRPPEQALHRISWEGDDRPLRPEADPAKAYDEVFGALIRRCEGGGASSDPDPRERRVLDLLRVELRSARRKLGLGAEERQKLERYEEALERTEKMALAESRRAAKAPDGCLRRPAPPVPGVLEPAAAARAHADILVTALALGLRRVATLQMFGPYSNQSYSSWLPVADKPHHAMTHDKGYPARVSDTATIVRWHFTEFARVLGQLQSFPEEGGDLLGRSLVVMGTDVPNAFTHDHKEPMCTLVAGGLLRGRVRVTGPRRENCELLATCARALGVNPTHFHGMPGYRGDIDELLRV